MKMVIMLMAMTFLGMTELDMIKMDTTEIYLNVVKALINVPSCGRPSLSVVWGAVDDSTAFFWGII